MNEWLLILAFVILLVIPQFFLSRVKQPIRTYIRITGAILLLVLVRGFAGKELWPVQWIMTALVIASTADAYKQYRELSVDLGSDRKA